MSACSAGDPGLISGLGRSPGGGRYGNPLQYSCLKNPHRQRSLARHSPGGRKQSDTTEQLSHSTQRAKSSASSFLFGSSYPYLKKEEKKKKNLFLGIKIFQIPKQKNKNKCLISNSNHMNQKLQEWVGLRNVDCNTLSLQRDLREMECTSHCNYQPSPFNQ